MTQREREKSLRGSIVLALRALRSSFDSGSLMAGSGRDFVQFDPKGELRYGTFVPRFVAPGTLKSKRNC